MRVNSDDWEIGEMSGKNRTWVEIDLDAVGQNIREIKKHLRPNVRLMGIVKADAYGHGVAEVAETILENGADCLGVALVDEAEELRKAGFDTPILLLGNSFEDDIESIVDLDIMPTVSDVVFAEKLSAVASSRQKEVKVHIKIDTGMSRIGFLVDSQKNLGKTCEDILTVSKLPGIKIDGIFTHFATADEENAEYTIMQYERFMNCINRLEQQGVKIPVKHACNSAALVKFPHMQLDMVRAGIIVYGMYPSREFDRQSIRLVPAMTFKSRISHIKKVDSGTAFSYGGTYTSDKPMVVATVPVGYADGYSRNLSNNAEMLVGGEKVSQIGRICMDQCMIDVTKVNNINVGDEVTLFGGEGDQSVTVDDIAERLGTINYEVTCAVGRRVPRIYIKNGKIVKKLNYVCGQND